MLRHENVIRPEVFSFFLFKQSGLLWLVSDNITKTDVLPQLSYEMLLTCATYRVVNVFDFSYICAIKDI